MKVRHQPIHRAEETDQRAERTASSHLGNDDIFAILTHRRQKCPKTAALIRNPAFHLNSTSDILRQHIMNHMLSWSRSLPQGLRLSSFAATMCLGLGLSGGAEANPGADLFQGFRQHIRTQITQDRQTFSIADTCTIWFYRHQPPQSAPNPSVEAIRFTQAEPLDPAHECLKRFPGGLESARTDFGKAQKALSLSLTFFQMVLVGDKDDNEEYDLQETRDLLEAFGLPFFSHQPVTQYLPHLTGLFDRMRSTIEFTELMNGIQALMNKGYRLTESDQAQLSSELTG